MAFDIQTVLSAPASFMASILVFHAMFGLVSMLRAARDCQQKRSRSHEEPARAPHAKRSEEHADCQQERVATRLAEMHVDFLSMFLHVWLQLCAVYAAHFLVRVVLELPGMIDGVMAGLFAVSYLTALLPRVVPQIMENSFVWMWYSWYMGLLLCFAGYIIHLDASLFVHFYAQIFLIRVALSFCYPVAWVNISWNVAWGAMTVFGNLRASAVGARVGIHLPNMISNEIMVAFFLSHLLWRFDLLQKSQVRSDLQATGYLRAKKTMERLLADMCDAVVELDQDLTIRQHCPKLAGLLIRQIGTTALKDEQFASLVHTEGDRNRWQDFVMRRSVPMEHEENFHDDEYGSSMFLNLRDAYGTPVSVQLFHSCHHDPSDDVCHVVGVREVEAFTRAGAEPDTFAQADVREVPVHQATPANAAESLVTSPPNNRSGSAVMAPILRENNTQADVRVIFDAHSYNVLACTAGFRSHVGPILYKASLRDLVVNFDEFDNWVREELNGYFVEEPASSFKVRMAPAMGSSEASAEVQGDAFVFEVHNGTTATQLGVLPEGADQEAFELLVVMVIVNVSSQPKSSADVSPRLRHHLL